MTLREHLKCTGERVFDFADRLGVSRSTIRKIVYGKRQPSLDLAHKISAATDGAVQPKDMLLEKEAA